MPLSFPQNPQTGDQYLYNNRTYTFDGTVWGSGLAEGGGASVEVADVAPEDPDEGNLWLDSDTGIMSAFLGGSWIQISGDSGVVVYNRSTTPTNAANGDFWFDTESGITSIYYDDNWLAVSGGDIDFSSIAQNINTSGTVKAGNPFYLNNNTISADYTLPANTNAMTAGPITIADDVTVTVPDGSEWTVV